MSKIDELSKVSQETLTEEFKKGIKALELKWAELMDEPTTQQEDQTSLVPEVEP